MKHKLGGKMKYSAKSVSIQKIHNMLTYNQQIAHSTQSEQTATKYIT